MKSELHFREMKETENKLKKQLDEAKKRYQYNAGFKAYSQSYMFFNLPDIEYHLYSKQKYNLNTSHVSRLIISYQNIKYFYKTVVIVFRLELI